MQRSTKRSAGLFVVLFGLLVLCLGGLSLSRSYIVTYAQDAIRESVPLVTTNIVNDELNKRSDDLTNEDFFMYNGVEIKLSDFMINLKKNKYLNPPSDLFNEYRDELNACLTRFIPFDKLPKTGTYQYGYIGKEYSFAIRSSVNLQSERIADIIFVDNVYDFSHEDTGEMSVRINVAKRTFLYHEMKNEKESFWSDYHSSIGGFYVRNVDFGCILSNENDLNTGDEGYDKRIDPGAIIRQSSIQYNGVTMRGGGSDWKSVSKLFVRKGLGALASVFGVGDIYDGLQAGISNMELLGEYIEGGVQEVSVGAESTIFTEQIKAWQQNDQSVTELSKAAAISPKEGEDFFIDDYAQAIFTVHDGTAVTNCCLRVQYEIVRRESNLDIQTYVTAKDAKAGEVLFKNFNHKTAQEGTNKGYNLTKDSEQVWEFTPDKSGDYEISVNKGCVGIFDHNQVQRDSITQSTVKRALVEGTTYDIVVKSVDTVYYDMQIVFHPQKIEAGTHTLEIGNVPVYYTIHSDTLQAFNLYTEGVNNDVQVSISQDGETFVAFSRDSRHGFRLTGDAILRIGKMSTANTDPIHFTLHLDTAQTIEEKRYYTVNDMQSVLLRFAPKCSTIYAIDIDAAHPIQLYVCDDLGNRMWQFDGSADVLHLMGEQIYYLEVICKNNYVTNAQISIRSVPELLHAGTNTLFQYTSRNLYVFTPACSAYYTLQATGFQATNVRRADVYTQYGQCISQESDSATVAYMEKDTQYYIVTNGRYGDFTLDIFPQVTTALTGKLNDKGNTLIAFTPTLAERYKIVGTNSYTWYTQALVATDLALTEGDTYYAYISGEPNAAYSVQVVPDVPQLSFNMRYNMNAGLYRINVTSPFYVKTYCPTGTSSTFSVYDEALQSVITEVSADGDPQHIQSEEGIYYIDFHIQNGSTISVELIADGADGQAQLQAGTEAVVTIQPSEIKTFTFECAATGTYWFGVSSAVAPHLTVIDRSTSVGISYTQVNRHNTGFAFVYAVNLAAGKTYNIGLTSLYGEFMQCSLLLKIPTRLQRVALDDRTIYDAEQPAENTCGFAMGKEYAFSALFNANATDITLHWQFADNGNPSNIAQKVSENTIRIGFNAALHEKTITILLTDDYGTYTERLVLKFPVYASAEIVGGWEMRIRLTDLQGQAVSLALRHTEIMIGNTVQKVFSGPYGDVGDLPIYEDTQIYAKVDLEVDGIEYTCTTPKVTFYMTKTTLTTFTTDAFTGTRRLVIDARNDNVNVNKTLTMPFTVKYLLIIGNNGRVYQNVHIVAAESFSLYTKDFRATSASMKLYFLGGCTWRSEGDVSFAGSAGNAVITASHALRIELDGTLTVAGIKVDGKDGVAGIVCDEDITVIGSGNSRIVVRGADGGNATATHIAGYNGGVGIRCASLNVSGCSYEFTGGNGGNGGEGAKGGNGGTGQVGGDGAVGGRGGNGAPQIYATGTVTGVSVNASGSCGGNGGQGGKGGDGADGTSADRNGKDGGRGGDGGYGGDGAQYIIASNITSGRAVNGHRGNGGRGGNGGDGADGKNDTSVSGKATAGGNGGNGGRGGDGFWKGNYGNGGNGGNGGSVGSYGNGKNGGHGGSGYVAGNGGNGSKGKGLGKDGGDGGNGGDSILRKGAWACSDTALAGVGGTGGGKGTGGSKGSKGMDGYAYYVD